jgi:hypothetical protein
MNASARWSSSLIFSAPKCRGLGEGRTAFVLPLLAQKTWDKWTLYGNVGFWWQTAAETHNYVYAGAVLEREINERLNAGRGVVWQSAERTRRPV